MQPLNDYMASVVDAGSFVESPPEHGWFERAQAQADRYSRLGFVLSVLFLASAATYALSLSRQTEPFFTAIYDGVNSAALKAGFRIERLALSGAVNTPAAEVATALGLPSDKAILFYNTEEARNRLLGIGWVKAATIRRAFPATLEVNLIEYAPFARWASEGVTYAIDRDGRKLGKIEDGKFDSLPLLAGEQAPAEAAAIVDMLRKHGDIASKMQKAELVLGHYWIMTFSNGMTAKLPRKVADLHLVRLETLFSNGKVAESGVDTIDLRLPHRTILQLKDATVQARDKAVALLSRSATAENSEPLRRSRSP